MIFIHPMSKSLSRRAAGGGCVVKVAGLILFLIGGALTYFFVTSWGIRMYQSSSWAPLTCRVISSSVGYHAGDSDSGPTYSIDISYSYTVEGKEYTSDSYRVVDSASSGESSKQEVVDQYTPGHEFTCYVNPNDPKDAVIRPGFHLLALVGLLPLLLLLIGIALLWPWKSRAPVKSKFTNDFEPSNRTSKQLSPSATPLQKVLISLLVALFWNGIVSIFVVVVIKEWLAGTGSLFPLLFLSIFVIIGLFFIALVFHSILALGNPRVILTLAEFPVRLGDSIRLKWDTHGNSSRVESLSIRIEGTELEQYRKGTDTYTDTNVFYRKVLKEVISASEMRMGETILEIPSNLMHSFVGGSNRIGWVLKVEGKIPGWPDISDDYPLDVQPLPRRPH